MWVGTNVRFCYTVFIKKKGDFLAMKRTFLFATIASILSINAYAASATVTSKDYVDTTRQATIPASGTNSATPGDTVVTYTSTAGTIGERGICDAEADLAISGCNNGDLVTNDLLNNRMDLLSGPTGTVPVYDLDGYLGSEARGIYDGSNGYNSSADADKLVTAAALQSATNLPQKNVTYKECIEWSGTPHTDSNCLLWNLIDTSVVYSQCSTAADCYQCSDCVNHMCVNCWVN